MCSSTNISQATAGVLRELGAVPVLLRALRRGAWGDGSEVPHTLLQIIVNLVTLCAPTKNVGYPTEFTEGSEYQKILS